MYLIVISGFVSGQQQYFRVPPSDQEVGEGGTVDIPCEVGNRRGRVQWTKDGLTLGKTLLKVVTRTNERDKSMIKAIRKGFF